MGNDWTTGIPGDNWTTRDDSEVGPVTVTPDPIIFELTIVDPTVLVGGEGVTLTPDPIVFELTLVDPTVILAGPITITPDPIVFELMILNPLVYGGGRSNGDHALLMTVGL
jgi:hypothetical protein